MKKQPKTNKQTNKQNPLQLMATGGSWGGAGQAVYAGDALICCGRHMMGAAGASSTADRERSFRQTLSVGMKQIEIKISKKHSWMFR